MSWLREKFLTLQHHVVRASTPYRDLNREHQKILEDIRRSLSAHGEQTREHQKSLEDIGRTLNAYGDLASVATRLDDLRIHHDELRAHYDDLRGQYDAVVRSNNKLENERNALSRELQKSQRLREIGCAPGKTPIAVEFPRKLAEVEGVLPITIVDVGAQLLDSENHAYAPLERAQACRKVAFEPIAEEAKKLAEAEPHTVVLPHFVGKGGRATFGLARFSPTSSLLEPNTAFLRKFMALPEMCERVANSEVITTRLDDIEEMVGCDFLKLDVQGGERDVLIGAEKTLEDTIVVQTEVEFAPLYKGQALFADLDSFLRERGFELIDLIKLGYGGYAALPARTTESRLLWADGVYFKSPERLAQQGAVQLLKAAFIAHVNYGYYDLAADYIRHYDQRVGAQAHPAYTSSV